jgi:hypothetical protein
MQMREGSTRSSDVRHFYQVKLDWIAVVMVLLLCCARSVAIAMGDVSVLG